MAIQLLQPLQAESRLLNFYTWRKFYTFLAFNIIWFQYLNWFSLYPANPDDQKRALVIGGGIANFTDVAATFSGIIRALKEKVSLWS